MMYSEFVAGTGCRENEHNYEVFKNLEIMYMNSDMSKEEIYEYGKKLVDNSKSEEQMKLEKEIKEEIKECRKEIRWNNSQIAMYETFLETESNNEWRADWKSAIKGYRQSNREIRARIKGLKWVLGA